tara:strand:- start:260 stop:619 length:360 start_codon:yes stop_codon:yes gene_type:complete
MDKKKPTKKDEQKENVVIDIKQPTELIKQESGIYHDGKRYLYEPDEEFKSCCFNIDKECAYYIGKMIISMSVLAFSFLMLQNPANDVAFYTSTISLLLGHFLNTPTNQNKKDKQNKNID